MIEFRPVVADDVPQLQEWLGREHVAKWWRDEDASTYLAQPHEHFLIVVDGRPVGMIQSYIWPGRPGLGGVDLFIGEQALTGVGLGPRVLAAFVDEVVFADPSTTACEATVEEPNRRSWRAFEKAGFRHVRDVEEDGLPHRLMRLDR